MSSIVNLIEQQAVINISDGGTVDVHEEGIVNVVDLNTVIDYNEPQLIINIEGDLMPAGPSNIVLTAGQNLSALRAVTTDVNGNAVYASNATLADAVSVVGITQTSASIGAPVTITDTGVITDLSWNWTKGPVVLGTNGMLTQASPPPGGVLVHLGRALSPTTILVDIDLVIQTI